jgi:hypothetical protein
LYMKTKLNNSIFKLSYCSQPIVKFGMSLEIFNKILKLVEKDDIAIYCYIESTEKDNLIIRIKNKEKKNKRIFKIPLQMLNPDIKPPITLNFEKKIIMDGTIFHDTCKKINNNSSFVEINCSNDNVKFNCYGDNNGSISINDDLEIINLNNDNIKGLYETKNILLFCKLITLTDKIILFIKNNYALTSVYSFEKFGSVTSILSPINDEYINNLEYDYSDDEDDIELIKGNSNMIDY